MFDGNGNIRKLTDSTGVVTDTYTYDAFGVTTTSTGVTANPYRYCGEYQDETTGLYYLRARYYDANTGRFTSADSYSGTTSDPISLHKYLYAHANPVMNSDPTGYFTLFEVSAVLNIQSKIKTASVSAAIGGLMSMMDALLGGERDPLNLAKSFASGAITGALVGAVFGKLTAVANAGGVYANVALMTKLGLASLGVGLGGISTVQSFSEGKNLQGVFRGINTAIGIHGLKKAFGSAMATFKSSGSGSSVNNGSSTNSASYYEYKALRQQGYNSSEAYGLMKQFRNGVNPNNKFAFHFTSLKGGKGITDSGFIKGSTSGVRGKGIYAGTTSTPSWFLKHIPYVGWGLGSAPVRIPIPMNASTPYKSYNFPMKSIVIKLESFNLR